MTTAISPGKARDKLRTWLPLASGTVAALIMWGRWR